MSSVDDRIVNMQFNNKQFESGVAQSTKTLDGLERTLVNTSKSKGLTTLGENANTVSSRFSAMKVAGIAAIATIASKATMAGLTLLKSFTLDPITSGFREYETNLNSIQTIMANTGKKVGVVNKYLNDLNHYSDATIYNFSQMADSIGKFTAAGVPLADATSSIKGMANMAALSGANVNQLNTAMYQMSQALSTGTIRLMDWNSLANAGMGGENIRNALMMTNRTLDDHGKLMDESIKKYGSFRDSLTSGWLSAETFNKTMKVMAGTTNDAGKTVAYTVQQLKGMGYSAEAAKDLHKLSAASIDSATKIKTFSQLLDVVKESVGSGWAKIFQDLFGNFNEASSLWTSVGTKITNVVGNVFGAVDRMLVGWRELGGYEDLWTGFGNIFKILGNLIAPFVAAFKELLPATGQAGSGLAKTTSAFATFTGVLLKVSEGAKFLTPVFVGVARVIKFLFSQIGSLIDIGRQLAPVFSAIGSAVGGLTQQGYEIGANIVGGIVEGLNVGALKAAVVNVATGIVDWIKGALGIHSPAAELIPVGVNIILGIAQGIGQAVAYLWTALGNVASTVMDGFKQLFGGMDAIDLASLLNAVLAGAVLLTVRNFVNNLSSFTGIAKSISGFFDSLGGSINTFAESLGTQAKAELIRAYAIAIAVLAASLVVLSFLDVKALGKSLGAMGVMLSMLVGSLYALGKVNSEINMATIGAAILLISMAMLNLAIAVSILGRQDLQSLAKGLGAMAIGLGLMVKAVQSMAGIEGSLISAGVAMVAIAVAMNVMALAILSLGNMSLETLAKGLGSMAVGLKLMTVALTQLTSTASAPELLAASTAILLVSTAMLVLSAAVLAFGNMDMSTLAVGFTAMAVGLGIMVAALALLSGNAEGVLAAAGAMVLMATAMNMLVGVILVLGSAPWETVARGLTFVAAALAVFLLAGLGAMYVAPGLLALGVSLALIGAGLALAGLGMLAFGTGFALLAAAGVAGVAILVAAFQAFMALLPVFSMQIAAAFVTFLETIAKASPRIRDAVGEIFANMIGVVTDAMPELAKLFKAIVNALFDVLSDAIPKAAKLVGKLIKAILGVVTDAIPQYGKLISTLIETGLQVITNAVDDMIAAGIHIIMSFLDGITEATPKIAAKGTALIIAFINAIADNGPKIVDSAAKAIIKFVNGLATAIDNNASDLRAAGLNLARAIIDGLTGGLLSEGMSAVKGAVESVADAIPGWAKNALHINSPSKLMIPIGSSVGEGVAVGIDKSSRFVKDATDRMARLATSSMSGVISEQAKSAVRAAVAMANAIIADGSKQVLALQRKASQKQTDAYRAQAAANIEKKQYQAADHASNRADRAADKANKEADRAETRADKLEAQAEKAKKQHADNAKKLAEQAKAAEKAADRMKDAAKSQEKAAKAQEKAANAQSKAADKAQKAADKAQNKADKASSKVDAQKEFEAADLEGKGDLKKQEAQQIANRANALLAKAKAEAAEGAKLRDSKNKKDRKAGKELIKQAKADAKAAQAYADDAQKAKNQADDYYRRAKMLLAKAVYARIDDIQADRAADAAARKAEAEYEAASTQGKADIMAARAKASQANADAANQAATQAMQQARALAETDADAANAKLDYAEQLVSQAKQFADDAESQKKQAADLLEQAKTEAASGGGQSDSGGGTVSSPGASGSITPSRSALEDASKAIDRHTASLLAAQAAAAAEAPVVQFVQTNNSPVALSAAEIYRQSKNLLSLAEIKMGAGLPG